MAEDQSEPQSLDPEIKDYLDKLFVVSEGHQIGSSNPASDAQKTEIASKFKKRSTQEIILQSQGQTQDFIEDLQKHGNQSEVATKLADIGMQSMILKGKGKDSAFIEELQKVALAELLRRYPEQKDFVKEKVVSSKSLKKYSSSFGWKEE